MATPPGDGLTLDPVSIWIRGAIPAFFGSDGETDADRIKRLEKEVSTGRSRVVIGKGINPDQRVTYSPEAMEAKRDQLADLYEKYGVTVGKYGITLAGLRGVTTAPPPIAPPPIAPPTVTTPPAVIEPPPRVVTGEVLTASQKIAYDEALRQFRTFEGLAKYGGKGSVGGALRLGAALWQEFGQEILIENAQKAAAAKARAAAAEARKGPLGRRAKTAKSGKIKRPPQPPSPGKPPSPGQRSPVADAANQAKAQIAAARLTPKAEDFAGKVQSKGPQTRLRGANRPVVGPTATNQPVLTRSQMLGIGFAGAAALAAVLGPKGSQQLLKSAEETLATPNPKPDLQTQLQPATGSSGGGQLGTQTRTAEGNKGERCRIVCRKTGKRKNKKRSRKVCIDKGTLTKFVKSTIKGK